jgi:hypothetical protein
MHMSVSTKNKVHASHTGTTDDNTKLTQKIATAKQMISRSRAFIRGNAFRRPAAYRSLTDAHIADIFVRVDRYGRPPGV